MVWQPKKIHVYIVQILAEDSPSYAAKEKKRAVEFKRSRDRIEDDHQSGRLKTSTTEKQVHDILRIVFHDTVLTQFLEIRNLSAKWN